MYTHFLALILLASLHEKPPQILAPHRSHEECAAKALEKNQQDADLRKPEAVAAGMTYVCLKLVAPT